MGDEPVKYTKPQIAPFLVLAPLLMTGCSNLGDNQTPIESSLSTPQPSGLQTPNIMPSIHQMNGLFPGDRAVSAAKYWQENPNEAPEFLSTAIPILDIEGVGATTVELESLNENSTYVLILTCDVPSTYRVSLLDSKGNELSWTGGDSCGGPYLGTYTTPPLTIAPSLVEVDVPNETKTALVVYSIPSQSHQGWSP